MTAKTHGRGCWTGRNLKRTKSEEGARKAGSCSGVRTRPFPHSILGAGIQQQLEPQLQPQEAEAPRRLIFGLGNEKNVLCPRCRQLSKKHSVESGQDERW